jgi:hypothetical protein
MPREQTYLPTILTALDTMLREIQRKLEAAGGAHLPLGADSTTRGGAPTLPTAATVASELRDRMARLEEVRDLVNEYPELVSVIDSVIGNQIAAAQRRQRVWSIAATVASLIVGWLLSLIGTPQTLGRLLHL